MLVAFKGKMDLAVNIAIGSSAQVALFVAPVLVFASFAIGPSPMPLVFNGFELGAILLAALIANAVTSEGESTWFEGVQLLGIRRPRVDGGTARRVRESPMARVAPCAEGVALQEAAVEGGDQVPREVFDSLRPRRLPQRRFQLPLVVPSVEEAQEGQERRGNDDHVFRIPKRVAHEQPWPVRNRREHDVEVPAQGRQRARHRQPWYPGPSPDGRPPGPVLD